MVAFEVDPRLVLELRDRFALLLGDRFFLYDRDYLKVDLAGVFRELGIPGKAKLIANIPYYITTPILEKLIEERPFYSDIYLTVQREVAERITARPGTSEYGSLTIFVSYHFEPEILFHISPRSFRPVPKVSSSLLHLRPRPVPPVQVQDEALFFRIVRAAFGGRRKMLRTVLRNLFPDTDLDRLEKATGIALDRRGETLSMEEFARLANARAKGNCPKG